MVDFRSIVRGVVLQVLYEIDSAHHPRKDVLIFHNEADFLKQDDARMVGYLALYHYYQSNPNTSPPELFDLKLNMPLDHRTPVQQALIDFLTEGVPDEAVEALTDEENALLERQVIVPDNEEFDLKAKSSLVLLPTRERRLVYRMVTGVLEYRDALDALIRRYAPEWPLDQLAIVDRNVLRMAIYEIAVRHTPLPIAIAESVELARVFGSESAPRFVNGVLSAIADSYKEILGQFAAHPQEEAEVEP